jgi:hypothetical protein
VGGSDLLGDRDELNAGVELVGRTGARELEIGFADDAEPAVDWWASAKYRGARIDVEHYPTPAAAVHALAQRLLTGAQCNHCRGLIALSDEGALFLPGMVMADGSTFTLEEATSRPQCRWRRVGRTWRRGCEQ